MTEVKIHGHLSKIIGYSFKFHLGNLKDVAKALDCINPIFRKTILELESKGMTYCMQKNGNLINILPLINGSGGVGRTFAKALSIILVVVGIVLLFVPGFQSLGFQLIMSGVQLGMAAFFPPKITFPKSQSSVGGATFSNESSGKSYVFSNVQNVASQGSLINIGYGKFLIGSKIIQVSLKNYSSNRTFVQENYFNFSEPESSTFLQENDLNIQNQ